MTSSEHGGNMFGEKKIPYAVPASVFAGVVTIASFAFMNWRRRKQEEKTSQQQVDEDDQPDSDDESSKGTGIIFGINFMLFILVLACLGIVYLISPMLIAMVDAFMLWAFDLRPVR